uniref:Uncharacterized protein n=1 Tax=Acrobeloides nanus TaxID=290746 RepID=A0A914CJS7_9BILA
MYFKFFIFILISCLYLYGITADEHGDLRRVTGLRVKRYGGYSSGCNYGRRKRYGTYTQTLYWVPWNGCYGNYFTYVPGNYYGASYGGYRAASSSSEGK